MIIVALRRVLHVGLLWRSHELISAWVGLLASVDIRLLVEILVVWLLHVI